MPKRETAKKEENFETSLARLDEIVKSLERGEATLDEALKLFEEGTRLLAHCGKQLDKAEQKVTRLVKGEDGKPRESLFDIGGAGA